MPAYLVVTATVSDREKFLAGYAPRAAELLEQFGGKYRMRAPGAEALEGSFGDGGSVVISEWESKAAARAFWNSPEYTEARTLREGICECQVILIEAPDITA